MPQPQPAKQNQHICRGLGIDPGLAATGFAVIGCLPRGGDLCDWGAVTTRAGEPPGTRLQEIYRGVRDLIDQWKPLVIAIEDIYTLAKYPRAAVQLGEVTGVIELAAAQADIACLRIRPTEVKHGLTGNGRAPKQQVHRAVQQALGLSNAITPDHASDAAAIALIALSRTGRYTW